MIGWKKWLPALTLAALLVLMVVLVLRAWEQPYIAQAELTQEPDLALESAAEGSPQQPVGTAAPVPTLAVDPTAPPPAAAAPQVEVLPSATAPPEPEYSGFLPYPRSPVIESVSWDLDSMKRAASGSDQFPVTWAGDGELYVTWGDGWGFSESGDKQYLGVSRLSGSPEDYTAKDLWHGVGKAHGIIAVDGALYILVTEQDQWLRGKLGRSNDYGESWTFDKDWTFNEAGGVFSSPGFLQFGQDYQGARDGYVYGYSESIREEIRPDLMMFRVPKERLMEREAYEFFAGLDGSGNPTWSADVDQRRPVFSDPNGVAWGVQAMYNPVLKRYLLTVRHDDEGSKWGLFDAPEPWGPWTTVAYYDHWLDGTTKLMYSFTQKWMSPDGLTNWMIFSGLDDFDSFNLIQATFKLR